jgi:hypothetical protein
MDSRIKRTALAIAVAAALATPGAALAQTANEKALEARVAELEKMVQQLMAEKAAAPAPAAAPAAAPAKAAAVEAPTVKTGTGSSLTIKGFVIASLYGQDSNFSFGNGQNAEVPTGDYKKDQWFIGGDVRNTRVTLDWKGPEVEGFKVGGTLETDFFGGFNGSGAFSDEQPVPRLRLAYLDIIKGDTTFRIGQAWSPLFGNVPTSPTHVAFPLGYGAAGDVGWRFPGLFIYHNFGGSESFSTKLTLAAMEGSWSGPGDNLNALSAGNSGIPQFEGRLDFTGKASGNPWGAYVVAHYDQKDCNSVNDSAALTPSCPSKSLDGTAFELGGKFGIGPFSMQGNYYTGKAIGQQFGNLTQFGDISSWGGWLQASLKFTPKWSGNLLYGIDDPNDNDVLDAKANKVKNQMIAASVMYSTGPYIFGVEWLNDKLNTATRNATTGDVSRDSITGNQISFSTWYKF